MLPLYFIYYLNLFHPHLLYTVDMCIYKLPVSKMMKHLRRLHKK